MAEESEVGRHKDGKTHHHAVTGTTAHASHKHSEKKGGAGKFNWGKQGEEGDGEPVKVLDKGDPLWEPDPAEVPEDGVEVVYPVEKDLLPSLVEPIILELFENGDVAEAGEGIAKYRSGPNGHVVVNLAITRSLDRSNAEREMVSKLICELMKRKCLEGGSVHVEQAFSDLLSRVGDLKLDVPRAPQLLGKFMARAVADDCLPPAFVKSHPAAKGDFADPVARVAVRKAKTLLSIPHAMSRLDDIWGHTGADKPVGMLVSSIHDFLEEYLASEDLTEAQRCLVELHAPHFFHEVVYEAIVTVLEHEGSERETKLIADFLAAMGQANIITPNQLELGVHRVYDNLKDLELDIPKARPCLETFLAVAAEAGALPAGLCDQAPTRSGRKRYLSENDGGRVKE